MRALFAGPSRSGLLWPVRVRTSPLLTRPSYSSSFSTSRVTARRSHLNALDSEAPVCNQTVTILDKFAKLRPKRQVVTWYAGDIFPGEVSLYRSPRKDKTTTMELPDAEDKIDQWLDTPEMRALNRRHSKEIFSTMRRRIKAYRKSKKGPDLDVEPINVIGDNHDDVLGRIKGYLDEKKTTSALSLAHLYLNGIWENAPRVEPDTEDTPAVDPPRYPESTGREAAAGRPRPPAAPHPRRHIQPVLWLKSETIFHLCDTYDRMIGLFLDAPEQGGFVAVRSLLERQHKEGFPVTHPMALTIFRLETLPVPLEIALGLLPPMDPELLGLALQAVVREKRPTPTLVRDAIIGCLQAGDEPTEKETWHWELWAALLDAYVASSTYKDALETLMEFVQIVKTTKAEALENDQCWPDERQGLITSMYTKLVKFWISCSTTVPSNLPEGAKVPPRIRREGSIVPTHLFMDLVLVLSPGRSDDGLSKVQLSRDFLVHYINAERIAGNVDTAMRGWEKLSGQTYEETLAGQQPPSELDDKSWVAFLRLLKLVDPPPPPSVYRTLATVVPPAAQSMLLSAAAVCRGGEVDMPLIMVLLANLPPGQREFDMGAAALIRSARLQGYYPSFPPPYMTSPTIWRNAPTQHSRSMTVSEMQNTPKVHQEWMWVRRCITSHTVTRPPRLPLSFVRKLQKVENPKAGPMLEVSFIKSTEEAPKHGIAQEFGIAHVADYTRALLRVIADLVAQAKRVEDYDAGRQPKSRVTCVHNVLSTILVRQYDGGPPASVADKFCAVIYPTEQPRHPTPPADSPTPPADSSTSPADSSTSPADISTPPADISTPPADISTPRVDGPTPQ